MKNKIIAALTIAFAIFFIVFIVRLTEDLSNAPTNILKSKNVIDVTEAISTRLKVSEENLNPDGSWVTQNFDDSQWLNIQIPTYQIVKLPNFKEGNFAYYRIKIPKKSFADIKHLENETSICLQTIFFNHFEIVINGVFHRTYRPQNAGEYRVIIPLIENSDNIVAIKAYINTDDTGIDSRNKIMMGKEVELNGLYTAIYKIQTVIQLVFILCKGSILFIFALIYLLLKVDNSFEKFFVFGICALAEELIASDYLYGPLSFHQMVYLYNFVNIVGAITVFLFFADITESKTNKIFINCVTICLTLVSFLLAADALNWNKVVDLTQFMKFWNLFTASVLILYVPKVLKRDKILFIVLLISIILYVTGALYSSNIGLNLKAYGNLLLFCMVAYQTFALFRREQGEFQVSQIKLLEQEKDVAIGKTASLLAHDVRKPLDQMKLIIEKIASGNADKEFLEVAKQDIDISISGVEQQVNEIINYSKQNQVTLVGVSLYRVLAHSVKQIMSVHQEMNIKLEYDFNAPFMIQGDQARLSSALTNLLANAVEAIRDIGGRYEGTIRITTSLAEELVTLKIFNNGPEIPETILNNIFKPLFTHGKSSGTGLGLASVVKTINEHKGKITVCNISGKGVEFNIEFLKCNETDNWELYDFKTSSKMYSYNVSAPSVLSTDLSCRVLILESRANRIEELKTILENLPFKCSVQVVGSYTEAEELVKKSRFDFYVLNQSLGGDRIKSGLLNFLSKELVLYLDEIPKDLDSRCIFAFETRPKILFVDDTKLFRVAWLMFHGSQNITCVGSPEEALALVGQSKVQPDLCVIDYFFSNSSMNGLALARKVYALMPSIQILISSNVVLEESCEFNIVSKKEYDVRKFLK